MGTTSGQGPTEKENRRSAELKTLERMRAPWFFEAEVQRRLRTGISARRSIRWHRVKIAAIYLLLATCLVVVYLKFGDRLWELMPQPALPTIPRADSLTMPPVDTSRVAADTPVTAAPRTEPRTVNMPVGDSARVTAAESARKDTVSPASPLQRDSVQEPPPIDTVRHAEPQPSVPRADSSQARPDSLGLPRGTP
jgi:hypothetical protein